MAWSRLVSFDFAFHLGEQIECSICVVADPAIVEFFDWERGVRRIRYCCRNEFRTSECERDVCEDSRWPMASYRGRPARLVRELSRLDADELLLEGFPRARDQSAEGIVLAARI